LRFDLIKVLAQFNESFSFAMCLLIIHQGQLKIVESSCILQVFSFLYKQGFEIRWRGVSALKVVENLQIKDVRILPDMDNVVD